MLTAGTDPLFVAAGRLVAGSLVIWLVLPFAGDDVSFAGAGARPWMLVAGFAMAGGLFGLCRAMDSAGASRAAAFAGLAPVVTAEAEWFVLDARFSATQLAGLLVVIAGAAVLAYRTQK